MGLLNIPVQILIVYILGFVGTPILVEIVVRSKWWKEKSDYYYSFNDKKDKK